MDTTDSLFMDGKELIPLEIDTDILDFSLLEYKGEIYFCIFLNVCMHFLLFQADSFEYEVI